jgi:PRC-barrel domain
MIRSFALATILATVFALPAIAQTSAGQSSNTPITISPLTKNVTLSEDEANAWIGKPIYSSDNKKIGEVVAFARDGSNVVTEMHAGTGGFLGIGDATVRLMPTQFKLEGDRVTLSVTSVQAKDLPKVTK